MAEKDDAIEISMEYLLKKYLLTLVATVTYAAGLTQPGGSWPEDSPGGRTAGDSILRETNYRRYIVFYCFNAISFAASLVVGLLLLVLRKGISVLLLHLMQTVMVVDLLGLVGAYAAGSSHDRFSTVCGAAVLVSGVVAYAAVKILSSARRRRRTQTPAEAAKEMAKEEAEAAKMPASEREILLVLAIFAATVTYVAGLNPPGGFWQTTEEGRHTAGDPVLQRLHPGRYRTFFFCNTTAFIASLLAIMLVVDHRKFHIIQAKLFRVWYVALYGFILTALLGLGGSYAAGSCRDSKHTIYVLSLVAPVVACIVLAWLLVDKQGTNHGRDDGDGKKYDDVNKIRDCIQLLATLAATIAYQAGVDPLGGVWSEDGAGHSLGDPILLTMHPGRFEVFFYFNSAAFVASLVIMAMLQKESLIRLHVLEKAMVLDLFALIGAYAAGSCRDTSTSIYTVAMAGAVLIYVVIHIVFFQAAADIRSWISTAGLTPPGGSWEEDDSKLGHRAGFPVLQDKYPRRYKAFFYCNAASFMASVALILLLLNANLYRPGIRCYALYVCMVAGMFGLMAAYAAGSSLHLRTSIIALALVIAVFVALVCMAIRLYHLSKKDGLSPSTREEAATTTATDDEPKKKEDDDMMQEYLMLVGILGASTTYLTGLKPPGGMWKDDDGGNGHAAGNPVLYDISRQRYNAFFYSNSTAFMASIVVMALLLLRMMCQWLPGHRHQLRLWPMHTAMFLGMAALLIF
ncbi:uncharacterized protein C2845_PM18G11600 [Panicum miliaceum]|uniref:PGG domain-containing protein n=1 Tax=Panicum miliaceum TaxID=4540 RepID=A0A3L6PMQ8_PANMI|nr:uncharacterized protein C2845_PM18G11600 [Panicum miliaceum]